MPRRMLSGWLPAAVVALALALTTVAIAVPLTGQNAATAGESRVRAAAVSGAVTSPFAGATGKTAARPAKTATRKAASKPSLEAYRGLGSWVDLYEDKAFADPARAVNDMAAHGVKTIFIETSNSKMSSAIMHPAQLATFIREAHKRHMYVVAWYLPDLKSVSMDAGRIAQAIRFRTSDGQRFDSFGMDIESTEIGSVPARNAALMELSTSVRRMVGPSYPLGAIIPSPLDISTGFWGDPFPYKAIAKTYDVFVPMSYYTFRTHGASTWYSRTVADLRTLRAQPGLSKVPIHMIGGLAENSNPAEVQALVRGIRASKCIGGSLYSYSGTSSGQWQQLKALAR